MWQQRYSFTNWNFYKFLFFPRRFIQCSDVFVYCCFVCFLFILCLCQDLHDKDNRKLLLHKPTFLYENCNVSWRWLSLLCEKKYFCGIKIRPFVCSVDTQWKCWKSWGNIFLVISVLVRDQTLKPGTARHLAIAILPYCFIVHIPYYTCHITYRALSWTQGGNLARKITCLLQKWRKNLVWR